MQERTVGNSGLKVSLVGLGTNNFSALTDLGTSREIVHKALDLGITLFDTADVYGGEFGGSESYLGQILGDRRKDVVLATKFGMKDLTAAPASSSRRYIMSAVEGSLRRLKTDWIDLYQLHIPDGTTPIEETLRALDDLIAQGKVRYVGSSNFAAWQVVEAHWTAEQRGLNRFISAQNEYSLLDRGIEHELIPALKAYNIGLLPYFPLASGLLTGKYQRDVSPPQGTRLAAWKGVANKYLTERNWDLIGALSGFAEQRGHSLLDLAFAWLAAHSSVSSVIAGATRPPQVEQNAKTAEWVLSHAELVEVGTLLDG
jgi:aryl-alcohol dehydrogenase-like predicted oxidoreductase